MEDAAIVELYWQRQERAIDESKTKYGAYCSSIAQRILSDRLDAEECVNDTWLGAWNALPPHRPACLKTFLGKIARNLSLKRRRSGAAAKRGGDVVSVSLDELQECVPSGDRADARIEAEELVRVIDAFLAGLSRDDRRMFICRYWYFDSVADIAERFGFTQSKVKMSLKRTRDSLSDHLRREGVNL